MSELLKIICLYKVGACYVRGMGGDTIGIIGGTEEEDKVHFVNVKKLTSHLKCIAEYFRASSGYIIMPEISLIVSM